MNEEQQKRDMSLDDQLALVGGLASVAGFIVLCLVLDQKHKRMTINKRNQDKAIQLKILSHLESIDKTLSRRN